MQLAKSWRSATYDLRFLYYIVSLLSKRVNAGASGLVIEYQT